MSRNMKVAVATGSLFWSAASVVGMAFGAWHGYKRNNSVIWAGVWAFAGAVAPVFTIPVGIAQGPGKKKGRK